MSKKRIKQLKFIANIFQMSLKEIEETLGFETLTMIFRRVGETTGEDIVKRFEGRYSNLTEFCNLLVAHVIEPVIGEGKGHVKIDEKNIYIELDACPYKKSGGFPIQKMGFFCHYTEGMFDTALKLAYPEKNFYLEPKDLIATGCKSCIFHAEIQ